MDGDGETGYDQTGTQDYGNLNSQDAYPPSSGFPEYPNHPSEDRYKDDYNSERDYEKNRYEETDVDEILNDDETHPDGQIAKMFAPFSDKSMEKPNQNGDIPMSNLLSKDGDNSYLNFDEAHDQGCGVDCMYYTLTCCECSIL